jgi:dTDP-4-amino-4,6-dideoxygalactose transaminase
MKKIAFVEQKRPDLSRVDSLLKLCESRNHWANRGPVYRLLQDRLKAYMNLPKGCGVVPVANGGVALEVMARLHAKRKGAKLRWVASAYSFQNLGRGYFSDVHFVDCDAGGLLSLPALEALDPDSYDGVIVTNPFGLYSDLSAFSDFAKRTGKAVLTDNAAGFFQDIPDLPWQAFSLHHTKPFGMGEGGVAVVPEEDEEALYGLVNYAAKVADEDREHWFQNGKISDISCAMVLDRLEHAEDWVPRNLTQRARVIALASEMNLRPLYRPDTGIPMTSMPFLSDEPITEEAVNATRFATCTKYYLPLAPLPNVQAIYQHLVNIPCHADMAQLNDDQIISDLAVLSAPLRSRSPGFSGSQFHSLECQAKAGPDPQEGGRSYDVYRDVGVPLQRF